jgi:hypothetical protein
MSGPPARGCKQLCHDLEEGCQWDLTVVGRNSGRLTQHHEVHHVFHDVAVSPHRRALLDHALQGIRAVLLRALALLPHCPSRAYVAPEVVSDASTALDELLVDLDGNEVAEWKVRAEIVDDMADGRLLHRLHEEVVQR